MTVVGETGDQLIDGAVGSETKYEDLIELFFKLNPSAEEFVPFRKPDPRLSADAPSFDFYSPNNIKDSSSEGSSTNPQPNRRRRKINDRNHDGQAPKQTCSSMLLPLQVSERPKEFPFKVRNQIYGSFPGQWRQAANLWIVSSAQSEMHQWLAYEFDRPSMSERLLFGGRSLISAREKKVEDLPGRIALA